MKKLRNCIGKAYLGLIFVFMYAPILTLIVYSFNAGKGRKWEGFSLAWYEKMIHSSAIGDAVFNTLTIAFLSALIATVIGVVSCLGLSAMKGKAKSIYMSLNNIPLLNSDLVTGLSLMLVFVAVGVTFGYSTVLLAHITFNVPYVILSVMPRVRNRNQSAYEAAVDLGARPLRAFFTVTVPEIMPGVLSGFLMAFTMSLDDFIITHFTKGPGINTISTLIYSEVRRGIQPTMNALSTVLFVSAILLLFLAGLGRKKEPAAAAKPKTAEK